MRRAEAAKTTFLDVVEVVVSASITKPPKVSSKCAPKCRPSTGVPIVIGLLANVVGVDIQMGDLISCRSSYACLTWVVWTLKIKYFLFSTV